MNFPVLVRDRLAQIEEFTEYIMYGKKAEEQARIICERNRHRIIVAGETVLPAIFKHNGHKFLQVIVPDKLDFDNSGLELSSYNREKSVSREKVSAYLNGKCGYLNVHRIE